MVLTMDAVIGLGKLFLKETRGWVNPLPIPAPALRFGTLYTGVKLRKNFPYDKSGAPLGNNLPVLALTPRHEKDTLYQ